MELPKVPYFLFDYNISRLIPGPLWTTAFKIFRGVPTTYARKTMSGSVVSTVSIEHKYKETNNI